MALLCEEISKNLNIYEKNSLKYTKCLVRGREIIISNKPEERVRQVLLYFLMHESGLFPQHISLEVEYKCFDIAICRNPLDENFRPWQPPVAIIEVKREEENLLNHEGQILRYLREARSEIGILFNCNQIISYKKSDNKDFVRKELQYITDIPALILQAASKTAGDFTEFQKAQNGDLKSFIYLIQKYGKYNNKFTFYIKNDNKPRTGWLFRYDRQNNIYYDGCGICSQKYQICFKDSEFAKLVAITY